MKVGISSYAFTWAIGVPGKKPDHPMTVLQLIEKATELKVSVLQIADNIALDNFSFSELEQIRKKAKAASVNIEIGARKMTAENIKKQVDLAVFFESPVLRFVIDGDDFQPDLPAIHRIIESTLPLFEKHHIVLAIENHDRFKAVDFVEIIKRSSSDCLGICLDTVNSMGAGEGLETVMEKLAPYTVNLHVKEFTIRRLSHQMGFIIEGCPLGEGMLPVEELINRVSPRCGSAILEQWTAEDSTIAETINKEARWAQISIDHLKNIMQ